MRIIKFFTIFTLFFIVELILLAFVQHPTIPLVHVVALSALVIGNMPWYATVYMLVGISLSAFLQGFCMTTNLIGFGCLAIASLLSHELMINTIIVQTFLVLVFAGIFIGINCLACFTFVNISITVLLTPFLILSLE